MEASRITNKKELIPVLIDVISGDTSLLDKYQVFENVDLRKIGLALDFILNNPKLSNQQKLYLMSNSWRINYRDRPPAPEEFLTDKYIGRMAPMVQPKISRCFQEFLDPKSSYRNAVLYPHIGWGKEINRYKTKICTPEGYKIADDIRVGDEVCTPAGDIARVINRATWSNDEFCDMQFADGRSVSSGLDHYWKAAKSYNTKRWDSSQKKYIKTAYPEPCWKIISSREILKDIEKNPKARWFIPLTNPVEHKQRIHVIPSYTLGALLGGGHFGNTLFLCGDDLEIHSRIKSEVPEGVFTHTRPNASCNYITTLVQEKSTLNLYKVELERLDLRRTRSHTKFIPEEYLYDSLANRIALLQGLMDTDGTVSKRSGLASYYTTSPFLRDNMLTLVRGLGGKSSYHVDSRKRPHCENGKEGYVIFITFPTNSFPIFSLLRKQILIDNHFNRSRIKRKPMYLYLKKIERTPNDEGLCIEVSGDEKLFLVDDYTVTHNSTLAVLINLYIITHLSMMRDAKRTFAQAPSAQLAIVLASYSLKKASEVLLEPFTSLLEVSDFFEKVRTKEDMIKMEKDYQRKTSIDRIYWTTASPNGTSAIQFSNNTNIKLISSVHNLLGLTVVAGTMTELAFFREAGKALSMDSEVITPSGFTLMRDIQVGDSVLTHKGTVSKVSRVIPQGKTRVFKLVFSDGREIKANPEHEWIIKKDRYWYKKTTQEIFEGSTNLKNMWGIPLSKPAPFNEKSHFIAPYIMGFALGDGSFRHNTFILSVGSDGDREESILNVSKDLNKDYTWSFSGYPSRYIRIIKKEKNTKIKNLYAEEIIKLGLVDKRSNDKFIPKEYLYDSILNRIELLQGLMDTDGSVNKGGGVFSSVSKTLAEDVVYLARSLGAFATLSMQKKREQIFFDGYHVCIHFKDNSIPLFKMSRKQKRIDEYWRGKQRSHRQILRLSSIKEIESEETQCITIEDEDHLFLANDFIVTSNSDEYIMKFYTSLKERIGSRMDKTPLGKFWGRSILDSSPNDLESPIDKYCMFEASKDKTNYVVKGSRWEWAPEDFKNLDDKFPVFKGSNGKPPEILYSTEGYDPSDIIMVPREIEQLFKDNIVEALKNTAGIPQGSIDKLFYQVDKIENCFFDQLKSLYTCIKSDAKMAPQKLIWNQVKNTFFIKSGDRYYFYYKPTIPRVFHVDQAISGDMAAIAFCHVEKKYDSAVTGKAFDLLTDLVYVIDAVIPIHPFGGRINLDSIKECITDFISEGNMPIEFGSFDSFQSEANIQFLERYGVEMEQLSVDKTMDPYLFLTQLIEQGNLKIGRNIFFKNNLRSLRIVQRKETRTLKVDHTPGDTINPNGADTNWDTSLLGINAKDVSDAVAGAVYLARMKLATEPRCLTQVWDDNNIILTPKQLKDSAQAFISKIGFVLSEGAPA